MRLIAVLFLFFVAMPVPAEAAVFTLRCTIAEEQGEMDFLFNTRDPEVLQRRVEGGVQLAKYQTLEMSYAQVIFAKYALMGKPKLRYKVARNGGPLFRSVRKTAWSDWEQVGTCRKR